MYIFVSDHLRTCNKKQYKYFPFYKLMDNESDNTGKLLEKTIITILKPPLNQDFNSETIRKK